MVPLLVKVSTTRFIKEYRKGNIGDDELRKIWDAGYQKTRFINTLGKVHPLSNLQMAKIYTTGGPWIVPYDINKIKSDARRNRMHNIGNRDNLNDIKDVAKMKLRVRKMILDAFVSKPDTESGLSASKPPSLHRSDTIKVVEHSNESAKHSTVGKAVKSSVGKYVLGGALLAGIPLSIYLYNKYKNKDNKGNIE